MWLTSSKKVTVTCSERYFTFKSVLPHTCIYSCLVDLCTRVFLVRKESKTEHCAAEQSNNIIILCV